jgi:hypothetical protein
LGTFGIVSLRLPKDEGAVGERVLSVSPSVLGTVGVVDDGVDGAGAGLKGLVNSGGWLEPAVLGGIIGTGGRYVGEEVSSRALGR